MNWNQLADQQKDYQIGRQTERHTNSKRSRKEKERTHLKSTEQNERHLNTILTQRNFEKVLSHLDTEGTPLIISEDDFLPEYGIPCQAQLS